MLEKLLWLWQVTVYRNRTLNRRTMSAAQLSIRTQSSDELAAIVHQLNPDLEYLRDLHPQATTCRTLLVKIEGAECALKVRNVTRNMWDETYFYLEIHALQRAGERNIKGVTQLLDEYKNDSFHAIIKSFKQGTSGNLFESDEILRKRDFIKQLDEIYLRLHLEGIAKVNFLPRKIVISDEGEITLVDLSTCVVNTEVGIQLFSQEVRADSRFINKLERNATH